MTASSWPAGLPPRFRPLAWRDDTGDALRPLQGDGAMTFRGQRAARRLFLLAIAAQAARAHQAPAGFHARGFKIGEQDGERHRADAIGPLRPARALSLLACTRHRRLLPSFRAITMATRIPNCLSRAISVVDLKRCRSDCRQPCHDAGRQAARARWRDELNERLR